MKKTGLGFNQVDRFTELVMSGKTVEEIMEITDLPKKTIKAVAKTLGLKFILPDEELRIKKLAVHVASEYRKKNNKKPESERDQSKKRKCLTCGHMFDSWGPGNRICKKHNETANGYWDGV